MEADKLAEAGLSGLNDGSPAYITREKSDVFTRRSSYEILVKLYEVNLKNKMKHTWMKCSQ